ncbi:hydrolase [Lachnoclostridium sp. An169]|uniref:C40 family peptidase n=1 Tax=Lachnoclostridium sp. An169 TaxID=1965569 RepID=UPI000B56FFB4|nr:C40 family peptidase [Lachnoclostridium sp. An169]OUP84123.1 hydrolase [Lachnoclostridium sp. An169]
MRKRRFTAGLTAAVMILFSAAGNVYADEGDTAELEQQKAEAQAEADSLQSQLNTLLEKMTELENALIDKGEEIQQAQTNLAAAEKKRQKQYEDMKLRIKYMYENGNATLIEMILESGDFTQILSRAEYAQKINEYDRNMLEEYARTVQEISDLQAALEQDMTTLEETETSYEEQQSQLTTLIEEKSSEVENLDVQIQEAARLAAEKEAEREAQAAAASRETSSQEHSDNSSSGSSQTSSTADSSPGTDSGSVSSGSSSSSGGSASYNASAASIIVNAAWSQVGVAEYIYGSQNPGVSFDCSGLTQWCYAQAGISIPRTSSEQLAAGTIVTDPQPGDICWTQGHVAIYIGNGQMIEAQKPGTLVCVSSVRATYYVRY